MLSNVKMVLYNRLPLKLGWPRNKWVSSNIKRTVKNFKNLEEIVFAITIAFILHQEIRAGS